MFLALVLGELTLIVLLLSSDVVLDWLLARAGEPLLVGFDFSFSAPLTVKGILFIFFTRWLLSKQNRRRPKNGRRRRLFLG